MLDKVKIAYGIVLILIILPGLVSTASAYENSELQWTEGVSKEIQRGQSLTYMGYTVKAVLFPSPVESDKYKEAPEESVQTFVGLEISKNDVFGETVLLATSESYVTPDGEIRVTVKQLPSALAKEWLFESYNPWVVVGIESRGVPNLEISIHTDKDEYSPSSEIPVTFTLENIGTADAVNVNMEIQTRLPVKRGQLKHQYNRVGKDDSITEELTFMSPTPDNQETFQIVANVSGYDVKDIPYSVKAQKNIVISLITPKCLSIRKSTSSKIYLKDMAVVSFSVKNSGDCFLKDVTITDRVPSNIKLVGNQTLNWVTDLPPNIEWDFSYLIKPTEPDRNGIVLPATTAKYRYRGEDYIVSSNEPKIIVYGPKITLSKTVDVSGVTEGSNVTVTITAENSGSTPTKVTIFDNISHDTTLINEVKSYENSVDSGKKVSLGYTYKVSECTKSIKGIAAYEDFLESAKSYTNWIAECKESVNGIAAYDNFLEADSKISFSYTLRINSNESLKLPSVSAEYNELGNIGNKISTETRGPDITIIHPEEKKVEETINETSTPTPTETPLPPRDLNESQDSITSNVSGDEKFNTFFLSYFWNSSNASFLNNPVKEIVEDPEIQEKNENQDIPNKNTFYGNNTIRNLINYINSSLFGGENDTVSNITEILSFNFSSQELNETSGSTNESVESGNYSIAIFFNYIKSSLFGMKNDTVSNESAILSSNLSLNNNNETSGNATSSEEFAINLIYGMSFITTLITSSLVLYFLIKFLKESSKNENG